MNGNAPCSFLGGASAHHHERNGGGVVRGQGRAIRVASASLADEAALRRHPPKSTPRPRNPTTTIPHSPTPFHGVGGWNPQTQFSPGAGSTPAATDAFVLPLASPLHHHHSGGVRGERRGVAWRCRSKLLLHGNGSACRLSTYSRASLAHLTFLAFLNEDLKTTTPNSRGNPLSRPTFTEINPPAPVRKDAGGARSWSRSRRSRTGGGGA